MGEDFVLERSLAGSAAATGGVIEGIVVSAIPRDRA
ncbi:hypothetical protein FX983_05777 [Pseudomonas frederiksbergensis]|uniref:Uncharacterized protein n=1 Tax=Pseudomonas frederiksbergensis TaxID=104087 RepID=A0A6L5BRC1_9PSED|nr:hypothetical protein FX983_05777 [Pseudomonas frederiksbergensis]